MKRLLLFMLCLLFAAPSFSQTRQDIYLVGTTTDYPKDFAGIFDGFIRVDKKKVRFDKDDPIFFHIGNPNAGYEVMLHHYNLCNRDRPYLFIEDIRIADLKSEVYPTVDIINIDEFFADKRKEEVWAWMLYHYLTGTYIWVVDYNSAYKSSEDLSAPDMVKAVQVRIFVDNIPEDFRREYYKAYYDATHTKIETDDFQILRFTQYDESGAMPKREKKKEI